MKLTVEQVIGLFDSPKDMQEKLVITKQNLSNWKAKGFVPATHAIAIHRLGLASVDVIPTKAGD